MSKKFYNIKIYNVGDYRITCKSRDTSYGFRHLCTIKHNSHKLVSSKNCYYNRTWESFEYESTINKAIDKLALNDNAIINKNLLKNTIKNQAIGEIDEELLFITKFASLGDILLNDKKGSNDFKKRILSTELSDKGLVFPDDWDTLPEDEKERRLNLVINSVNE